MIFSLAKTKVPALSGAKGGGSSTPDKGKSTPRKPIVIDRASLNLPEPICQYASIGLLTKAAKNIILWVDGQPVWIADGHCLAIVDAWLDALLGQSSATPHTALIVYSIVE